MPSRELEAIAASSLPVQVGTNTSSDRGGELIMPDVGLTLTGVDRCPVFRLATLTFDMFNTCCPSKEADEIESPSRCHLAVLVQIALVCSCFCCSMLLRSSVQAARARQTAVHGRPVSLPRARTPVPPIMPFSCSDS